MKRQSILVLLLLTVAVGLNQPAQAERKYVDTGEAEAVLDLMDGIAAGQVTDREDIIEHLQRIYETEGYQLMCKYHGMNPRKNSILSRIERVSRSIIHDQTEQLKGYDLYYYDIYEHRNQYREFLNRFKDWKPTEAVLARAYSYFPEEKPFTGNIYFVVDELSDGYTPIPHMVFSIYQVKRLLDERGVDFDKELFPHEFHHILTKQLLLEKYQEQLLDSSGLPYFLGYIMLEGYAVQATADQNTKNEVYMMKRSDEEIHELFARIEKVIRAKNENPDKHWRSIYREYFSKMIDIYTVGTTMVQAIEKEFGRDVVVEAIKNPSQFFRLYQKAASQSKKLYQFDQSTMQIIVEAIQ